MILLMAAAATAQTVFGLTLGQPLILPDCQMADPSHSRRAASQPVTCKEISDDKSPNHFSDFVVFPAGESPTIVASSLVGVWIEQGVLTGVEFDTLGYEDQERITRELSAKYGRPTTVTDLPVENLTGGHFAAKVVEWRLPNAFIHFDGVAGAITHGRVKIVTPEGKAILDREAAASDAKRTKL